MLRIKKDVDLKELEKFGFTINIALIEQELDDSNSYYTVAYFTGFFPQIEIRKDRKIYVFGTSKEALYEETEFVLFDLINAGLVEK